MKKFYILVLCAFMLCISSGVKAVEIEVPEIGIAGEPSVSINSSALGATKDVYNINDTITYTLKIVNPNADSTAFDVTVENMLDNNLTFLGLDKVTVTKNGVNLDTTIDYNSETGMLSVYLGDIEGEVVNTGTPTQQDVYLISFDAKINEDASSTTITNNATVKGVYLEDDQLYELIDTSALSFNTTLDNPEENIDEEDDTKPTSNDKTNNKPKDEANNNNPSNKLPKTGSNINAIIFTLLFAASLSSCLLLNRKYSFIK